MTPNQERDVRAVTLAARQALVILQNVEQGLLPHGALGQMVEPEVLASMGPIAPPSPCTLQPRVGRVRVHLVNERLAHVAAMGIRPDGRPSGYVLECSRESVRAEWRITELTRVEERRLVRPHDRLQARSREDSWRRLPADLGPLMSMTQDALDEARRQEREASVQLERIRAEIASLKGKRGKRYAPTRASLRMQERETVRNVARWQREATHITDDLQELREVHELREWKAAREQRDPLLHARDGQHLEGLLGPIPHDPSDRSAWRKTASTVESYRQRWGVRDPDLALGGTEVHLSAEQACDRDRVNETVRQYSTEHRQEQDRSAASPEIELDL